MLHRWKESFPIRSQFFERPAFGLSWSPLLIAALLLGACALGCRQAPLPVASTQMLAGRTMGTSYSIQFLPDADADLVQLASSVDAELELVNEQMSTYLPESEISRFNQLESSDWFSVSVETATVVARAKQFSEVTDGAFDATVAPLVELWGFGTGGRLEKMPDEAEIQTALKQIGMDGIEVRTEPPAIRKTNPALTLDLSAIAKGHGVDRIGELLEENGIENYFVEIGGEVRVRGHRLGGGPWRVGIEQPSAQAREIFGVAELEDLCLATSGNYRNFFEMDGVRYSHTISPLSGRPIKDPIVAASVLAEDCMTADAIATSMMSVGYEDGLRLAEEQGWAVMLMAVDEADAADEWMVTGSADFERLQPELSKRFTDRLPLRDEASADEAEPAIATGSDDAP